MGPRKTLVREVNPHLICVLCHGYFIEATTITECLHSFCRSCLIKYLETSKFCPICDVQLHKNNPLLSVRCDQTLQQLVYKLVPGLYANEMARRRKYYSELGGPSSDPDCSEYPVGDAYFAPEDSISLSLEFSTLSSCFKDDDTCASDGDDSLNMDKQNVLHRRYLQCPAAVTMSHLQKFLRMKYGFSHDVKVDIIYDGEVLSDHFSLMDVAYTFDWKRTAPMRFKFRLFQKAGTHAKGSSMERINRPLETKDKDDMILKPVAEAKVFAFASVPKQAPSISNKSTQSQPVNPKAVRESLVVMQCLDSKEVIMPSLSMREKNFFRESKAVQKEKNVFKDVKSATESKKFQEAKNGDITKPKNNAIENNNEKNKTIVTLKRTHLSSGDSEDEPPVEMKKLKIVLEPLTIGKESQGTVKVPSSRPAPLKIEAPKLESPKATSNSHLVQQSQTQPKKEHGQNKNHQCDSSEPNRKTKIGKEKAKESALKQQPMDEGDDEEEEPNYMDDIIQEDDYDEDEDEDRLRKTPSESDMVIEEKEEEAMDVQAESELPSDPMPDFKSNRYSKSEEKRKEKKKNKKAKHHHHRHHDRKRDSPPIATILHSPDSDLKLKFKLTNTNSKPKYTILDNSEAKKDFNYSFSKQQDKCNEKESPKELKIRLKEDEKVEVPKKAPSPVLNNNYNSLNNNNNNNTHQLKNIQPDQTKSVAMETGSKEKSVPLKISRTKVFHHTSAPKAPSPSVNTPKVPSPKVSSPVASSAPQMSKLGSQQSPAQVNPKVMNYLQKSSPSPKQQIPVNKQNGASSIKQEPIKMPPSSITVSKITAAEKAQMEQQKILMQRNNSMGLDSKRPSLEIMLVNAPKKGNETNADSKPVEVKKVIRPTPPSIPLSRLKNFGPKGSPPPLVLATNKSGSATGEDNGALDLSGKSSRKSPEIDSMRNLLMLSNTAAQERMLMTSLEPLKIPIPPAMNMKPGFQQSQQQPRSIKPGPNQNVRQIPNPSALMFRQHINNQRSVPPSLPINSLRKMESMAKNINIEKVAAGLTVKAAVQAGYQAK